MRNSALALWLAVLAAVLALTGLRLFQRSGARQAAAAQAAPSATNVEDLHWQVHDFTLTDKQGESFDTAQLRGKPWLASFFFSSCPGPCIQLNQAIRRLLDETPLSQAPILSITVDPRTDSPERLREYARLIKAESPRWRLLTGDPEEIVRIARDEFHVAAATAAHTERLILVGADGRIVGLFSPLDEADRARLRKKLAELEGPGA